MSRLQEKQKDILSIMMLSALIFIIYWKTLFYKFTGTDFFPFVYGATDLSKVFLDPLSNGVFPFGQFYRPLHSLTIYCNYSFGGLDQISYQLTNLFLFAIATILVYFFVKKFVDRKMGIMVSGFFITHPVIMTVVPFSSRRGDILALIFILATLISLAVYIDKNSRNWKLVAIISSFFAYLSKEPAIILPAIIFFFIFFKRKKEITIYEIKKIIIEMTPFIIIWLGYMAIRVVVLNGIGGYGFRYDLQVDFIVGGSFVFGTLIYSFFYLYPLSQINIGETEFVSYFGKSISYLEAVFVTSIFIILFSYLFLKTKAFLSSRINKINLEKFCLLWVLSFSFFYFINGEALPWYLIMIFVPASIILFKLVFKGDNKTIKIKKGLLAVFIIINILISPLIMPYWSFEKGAQIKNELVNIYDDVFSDLPDNSHVYLVNTFRGFTPEILTKSCGLPYYSIYSLIKLGNSSRDMKFTNVINFHVKYAGKNFSLNYEIEKNDNNIKINTFGENIEFEENWYQKYENIEINIREDTNGQTALIVIENYDEEDYIAVLYGGEDDIKVDVIPCVYCNVLQLIDIE